MPESAHVFMKEASRGAIRSLVRRWRAGDLRELLSRHHGANTDAKFLGWADAWLRPELATWSMVDRLPAVTCPVLAIGDLWH